MRNDMGKVRMTERTRTWIRPLPLFIFDGHSNRWWWYIRVFCKIFMDLYVCQVKILRSFNSQFVSLSRICRCRSIEFYQFLNCQRPKITIKMILRNCIAGAGLLNKRCTSQPSFLNSFPFKTDKLNAIELHSLSVWAFQVQPNDGNGKYLRTRHYRLHCWSSWACYIASVLQSLLQTH